MLAEFSQNTFFSSTSTNGVKALLNQNYYWLLLFIDNPLMCCLSASESSTLTTPLFCNLILYQYLNHSTNCHHTANPNLSEWLLWVVQLY